ncbi:Histone H4-like protein 1 [Colletotrichum chlorophyti]|uniref:Histone H4-like protein 1 n=1 Tax=Colletotrichum chlorophyti TaxID=708187 RepID=A0A1Q8RUN2_9PEZI|nr:Histone H4-like protein 1 [Colletotrichum chlorophyti]
MPPMVPNRGGPGGAKKGTAVHLGGNRLARRGGVKRISATIYDEARSAMKAWLHSVLKDCVAYVEHRKAKTVVVEDVIHSLSRRGTPIYGFDRDTYNPVKGRKGAAGHD